MRGLLRRVAGRRPEERRGVWIALGAALGLGTLLLTMLVLTRLEEVRCVLGSGAACYAAGEKFEAVGAPAAALRLYRRACDLGIGPACTVAGKYLRDGVGTRADQRAAKDLFQRACGANDADGCSALANTCESSGDKNCAGAARHKTVHLFRNLCAQDSQRACFRLGVMSRSSRAGAPGPTEGLAALTRACALGMGVGCAGAGQGYLVGFSGERDPRRASGLLARACNEYDISSACCALGSLYLKGDGVATDRARAIRLLERACEGGSQDACLGLWSQKEGIPEILRDSIRLITRTCSSEYPPGDCLRACPRVAAEDPTVSSALSTLERLCAGGEGRACHAIAAVYAHGVGVPPDLARAAAALQAGCDHGERESCSDLGLDYAMGIGVTQDLREAKRLWEKACTAGSATACASLK